MMKYQIYKSNPVKKEYTKEETSKFEEKLRRDFINGVKDYVGFHKEQYKMMLERYNGDNKDDLINKAFDLLAIGILGLFDNCSLYFDKRLKIVAYKDVVLNRNKRLIEDFYEKYNDEPKA